MSNPNAIQPSKHSFDNVSKDELSRMKDQLVTSMTGSFGKPLTPIQAAQIALISLTTDLSPFLGEVYATDKGIMIGVIAYERKSQEYLDAFLPGTNYHITYRTPTPSEAEYKPERGDIAYIAILTRDDWDRQWQVKLQDMVQILKEAGLTGKELFEIAISQIGPKPYVEAVGVVDGREDFSGTYKDGEYAGQERPEMFDRHERAKKRARKNVLKHVFPRLNIPDPMKILSENTAARLITEAQKPYEAPRVQIPAGMTADEYEQQLQKSLGYEVIETTAKNAETPDWLLDEPQGTTMTLETARNMTDSKGRKYGEMDNKSLSYMSGEIDKKLKLPSLPQEKREQYQMKMEAIRLLLSQETA